MILYVDWRPPGGRQSRQEHYLYCTKNDKPANQIIRPISAFTFSSIMLGLSFVNTVMEGTANMMDKHQDFICHVTPIYKT